MEITEDLILECIDELRQNQAKFSLYKGFLAFIPLLIYLLAKKGLKELKISKKGLIYSILLGVVTKGIFKLSLDTSMTLVGVATSTILMYLAPVWTAVMAMIFFKEKLRGYQNFALVLNLIGCILMVTGGNFTELNIPNPKEITDNQRISAFEFQQ